MELFFIAFTAIFSVMNPLGTVPIFVSLTKEHSLKEIKKTAKWTAINTFIILITAFFLGSFILSFFGISINALKIAGGLIIVSSGFALLTGTFSEHKGMRKKVKNDASSRSDIALTPLAIPMLAGPGTISLLITYRQEFTTSLNCIVIIIALILISVIVFSILRSAHFIVKFLGASGINALSRIIGFIVISIGIEYIISSIVSIFKSLSN